MKTVAAASTRAEAWVTPTRSRTHLRLASVLVASGGSAAEEFRE